MPTLPRELPHNLDAERSVIGALLIDNAGFDQVHGLDARHFFRDAHRRIYAAMLAMREAGRPVDLGLLAEELISRKDFEEVGGGAYLGSMVDGVPRATNVAYYAGIVKEKWALRRIIFTCDETLTQAYAAEQPSKEILSGLERKTTDLAGATADGQGAAAFSAAEMLADLDERVQRRGQLTGLPTGFSELDLLTHGWQSGTMVVIAGQTSFGKSILAMNTALAIARTGQRAVYYSFEMPKKAVMRRLWCGLAEIPVSRYVWGNFSDAEYAKLAAAMESIPETFEVNANGSRALADIRAECRQINADRGLAAVVLDHFQLMEGGEGENRTHQLAEISRKIQGLGRELNSTMFVLSQLTLKPEDIEREPHLEDLRECKSLAHDADGVFMLHPHEPKEVRKERPVALFKLLCRKQRDGRLGKVWLDMERDYVRFTQAEEPRPEPKPAKEPKADKPIKSPLQW